MRLWRLVAALGLSAVMLGGPMQPAPVSAAQRCFAETGQCVQGRFLDYWQAHGGLTRNGFPLTGERRETLEDGQEYTVQYFERVRLELHSENAAPYDVLLGQFGRRVMAVGYARTQDHRDYEHAIAPQGPIAGQTYFAETGHNVTGRFLAYWQQNGGLAQFGYPLSEERIDLLGDGKPYRTQYFERGRLELHPENAAPYDVLLGQFGRQILAENALLGGTFAALYQGSPGAREQLGAPRGLAMETPGAAQTFQRGLMIWRGDQRRIYVFAGPPVTSGVVLLAPTGQSSFVDTWTDGMPAGGGPAPTEPGAFVPQRGFFTVWREHEAVRSALGYAATPSEIGYTLRVQEFDGGTLITGDTPVGRFIYVIAVQRADRRGAPSVTYQAAWTERVGPPR